MGPVFYGPLPTIEELTQLKIQVVWNLALELEQTAIKEQQLFTTIWTPIEDYSVPEEENFKQDLNQIIEYLKIKKRIYIHCCAGRGRTGMALAALVIRTDLLTPKEALKVSFSHCQGPEKTVQRQFITNLFKSSILK